MRLAQPCTKTLSVHSETGAQMHRVMEALHMTTKLVQAENGYTHAGSQMIHTGFLQDFQGRRIIAKQMDKQAEEGAEQGRLLMPEVHADPLAGFIARSMREVLLGPTCKPDLTMVSELGPAGRCSTKHQ